MAISRRLQHPEESTEKISRIMVDHPDKCQIMIMVMRMREVNYPVIIGAMMIVTRMSCMLEEYQAAIIIYSLQEAMIGTANIIGRCCHKAN